MSATSISRTQRIIGLVLVYRTRLGRKTGDQAEMLDRQRVGAKPRVRREKTGECLKLRVAQPGQRDMRREFALLRRYPDPNQRLLDLVAQPRQFGVALDANPQRMRPAAAKDAGAGDLQR